MTRREFTRKIALLITDMISEAEEPILDYCLRDAQTQNRLFKEGKSKCDGYEILSPHQKGIAADIYLTETESNGTVTIRFNWDKDRAEKWHKIWEEKYGGNKVIDWDLPHFEG